MIGSSLDNTVAATTPSSPVFELQRPWNGTLAGISQPSLNGTQSVTLPGIASLVCVIPSSR